MGWRLSSASRGPVPRGEVPPPPPLSLVGKTIRHIIEFDFDIEASISIPTSFSTLLYRIDFNFDTDVDQIKCEIDVHRRVSEDALCGRHHRVLRVDVGEDAGHHTLGASF